MNCFRVSEQKNKRATYSISEGGGQRSGKLGVSLSLSLVQTVDRLVTGAWEGAGISRGGVGPVVVGGVGIAMGVPIGGVVVQRIGFRLSQAKRGYGENYDLNRREMLNTVFLCEYPVFYHALHFCLTVVTRLVATEAWRDRYIASPSHRSQCAGG